MSFRATYVSSWRQRLLDLACHVTVAALLPGPWWAQPLPDAMLPVLWSRAMVRDRFDPDDSPLLNAHRTLHLRGRLQVPALVLLMVLCWWHPLVAVQWLAHVAIDVATHGPEWM